LALATYDIDFKKLVQQLLGTILKKTKRVAWLTACLKPLRKLHYEFTFTDLKAYEIKWNGQTIKLEKRLIDKYGEGIYINNNSLELNGPFVGEGFDTSFFIGAAGDNSHFIDISYSIRGTNFTVHVSGTLTFVESEMTAYINKYKMFGTTYNIVYLTVDSMNIMVDDGGVTAD